jgi:hypothetical protein
MIKFWAWIYRRTEWYCPLARIAEYNYVMSELPKIEERYRDPKNDISLKSLIGITIGTWQVNHGFVTPWKFNDTEKRLKRFKKRNGL